MNLVVKSTWTRHLVGAAVLAALAACGGGGGGSANNNTGGSTEQTASVTGVAAKGLMKFAKVVVKDAVSGAVLKETTTDASGNYTVTGLPIGAVVLIEVSAVAGTKIVDEATNAEIDAPANFTLRAATVADAAGTANVQVTPFSEMAVAKALAADPDGKLSKSNITAANADIRAFAGFDVLAVKPEFEVDTDSNKPTKPKNAAALLLASVSQLANNDDDASALDAACTGSQAEKVKCVVEKLASKGSSDSDVVTLLNNGRKVAREGYSPRDPDEETPIFVAQPSELVPVTQYATAIDAAKALISNLRTNLSLISASGASEPEGGSLQTRLNGVATAFDQATNPIGRSSREVYGVAVRAAQLIDEDRVPGTTFTLTNGPTNAQINCTGSDSSDSGTLDTVECSIVYGQPEPDRGGKYVHVVNVGRSPSFSIPQEGVSTSSYAVRTSLVSRKLGSSDIVVAPSAAEERSSYSGYVSFTRESGSGYPRAIYLNGLFATGLAQALSGKAYYNNINYFNIYASTDSYQGDPTKQYISLNIDANISSEGGSAPIGTLSANGTIRSVFQDDGTGTIRVGEALMSERYGFLTISGSAGGKYVSGTLLLNSSQATANPAVYLPTSAQFNGNVSSSEEERLFNGSIFLNAESLSAYDRTQRYGASNIITNAELGFEGQLTVPGGKDLEVNITVSERSEEQGLYYTINGSYAQGRAPKEVISESSAPAAPSDYIRVMVAGVTKNSRGPGFLSFTDMASGLNLRIEQGEDFGLLTKTGGDNSVTLAKLNRKKAKIEYVDGSYEQY